MADANAPDADAPDAGAVDAPKKKGKLLLFLPVVALLLGGGGGYYQYQKATALPEEEAAEAPVEYGAFTSLPGFIVNPAGSGGRRYLMVDLALEAADEATIEEITSREVVLRDAVVAILAAQTVEELASIADRTALKDSIQSRVNEILEGEVSRLYFTQYVLQ
jgi:flagellar FliL protein